MPFPQGRAYGVYRGNVKFLHNDYHINSIENGITATAGGGRTNAYPIKSQFARVTTVATAGDSVQLPIAYEGVDILIVNSGANSLQVFANVNASDTIDDIAAATGVSQIANSAVIYACAIDGKWYTVGLGSGFSTTTPGVPLMASAKIAANATGTQASGTAVTAALTSVTSAASGYSVTLPVSAPGMAIEILLETASNTVKVFPNAGGTTTEAINALGANNAITMAALSSCTFICTLAGQWFTSPRVPS